MNYSIKHPDLGDILITPNKRAKNIIARRKNDYIQVTVPIGITRNRILATIERLKPQLLDLPSITKKAKVSVVSETDVIQTLTFSAHIKRHSLSDHIGISLQNKVLHISFPANSDIASPNNQQAIRQAIIWGLRNEAKKILPQKTAQFAKQFNLSYKEVKINSSKGRWGSCTSKKNINYSLFMLLLPEKLIDYIVLHELAHTIEMNHSERFWSLLNSFTDNKAKELAKELKRHKAEWYDFLVEK